MKLPKQWTVQEMTAAVLALLVMVLLCNFGVSMFKLGMIIAEWGQK